MLRRPLTLLTLLLTLVLPGGAAAAPSASTLKAQAIKLAAAGKHQQAAVRMSEARAALRRERRTATDAAQSSRTSPKYREAVRKLALRYRAQWEKGPRTPERRKQVYDAFTREKAAIDRKYGISRGGSRAAKDAAAQARAGAKFDLRDAAFEEIQAAYLEKLGNRKQAASLRQHALLQRTRALDTLGKKAEAEKTGARLLATNPRDPASFRAVAELYQNQGKYADAARVWERGIRALTTGGELRSKQRAQVLSGFYRQLAFSYQKSGKPGESRQALNRARELERK